MVGRTTSEIGDTDDNYDENIIDEHNNKFAPDLSPVSDGSSERTNRVDDKYNIFSDNSSLLGVIVDRSSFDEDDELLEDELREEAAREGSSIGSPRGVRVTCGCSTPGVHVLGSIGVGPISCSGGFKTLSVAVVTPPGCLKW